MNTALMPGGGPLLTSVGGTVDVVISKFTSALAHVWSVTMASTSDDLTAALVVDSTNGDIYWAGSFYAAGATVGGYSSSGAE